MSRANSFFIAVNGEDELGGGQRRARVAAVHSHVLPLVLLTLIFLRGCAYTLPYVRHLPRCFYVFTQVAAARTARIDAAIASVDALTWFDVVCHLAVFCQSKRRDVYLRTAISRYLDLS